MSILPLAKVTLCGLRSEKGPVLEELQRLGCMHLVSLRPEPREPEAVPAARAEDAHRALRYLLDTRRKRHPVREDETFDVGEVVERVLENEGRLREAVDRCDFLDQRIKELAPWGDFTLPGVPALRGYRLWFYVVPLPQMKELRELELAWEAVHLDPRHAWVLVLSPDEPPADALPVPRTHTGSISLSELRRQLELARIALDELHAEREALTRWAFLLAQNMARAEDRAALRHAASQTLDGEGVFAVQGWLPERELALLGGFSDERGLALLVEEPEPGDEPPTLLDNPGNLAGGQDVVSFYETPGYRTWDPSTVVFFSFAAFFAMILADAGYALFLGGILCVYWKRLGASPTGARLRILAASIVGASMVYGVITGSYLGVAPPEGSALAHLVLLDLNDFDTMMRLTIVIGAAHIVLANALSALHARDTRGRAVSLGWIAMVVAGLLYWLAMTGSVPAASARVGIVLGCLGLATLLCFSGTRKVRSARDAALRFLEGLLELTNVTKAFGDVLSYLRLWALGLASASLALTFNQLSREVAEAVPGLGLLVSLLILLVGHAINLALGVMSGLVHGLRLNFIEFFNWGLPEEGYPFRSFAKKEIEP